MRSFLLFLAVILLTCSQCKNKTRSLSGTDPIEITDFLEAFATATLPVVIVDTNMNVYTDTTTISYSIFTSFFSDSILTNVFADTNKLVIHPIKKFTVTDKETYLLVYASQRQKEAVLLLVLNKDKKFSAAMPLLTTNSNSKMITSATLDKNLGVTIYDDWSENETAYYKRITYGYNDVGTFTLLLNETNFIAEKTLGDSNPIDTFPQKNKLSGDYSTGKQNFLAMRDGDDAQSYQFFLHFNTGKQNECGGELRGRLKFTTANTALFKEKNNTCEIAFTFKGDKVTFKELGGCGNFRGIQCFFNDSYVKKKTQKPSKIK